MSEFNYWKAAFDCVHDAIEVGLHCAGYYDKERNFHPRTEKQDGWNEAYEAIHSRFRTFDKKCADLENDPLWRMKLELQASNNFYDFGEDWQLHLNMNDFFAWACAESEEVPDDKVEEVYRIWKAFPDEDALGAWASIRRGRRTSSACLEIQGRSRKVG